MTHRTLLPVDIPHTRSTMTAREPRGILAAELAWVVTLSLSSSVLWREGNLPHGAATVTQRGEAQTLGKGAGLLLPQKRELDSQGQSDRKRKLLSTAVWALQEITVDPQGRSPWPPWQGAQGEG